MQEAANKVVPLKGYNHFVAPGSWSAAQHGAVTYTKAELGEFTRISSIRADMIHLISHSLGIDLLNIYVAPSLIPKITKEPYIKAIDKVLNKETCLIGGDLN